MRSNTLVLSSGMAILNRLEILRQQCDLSVESILASSGGILSVSHVTYRYWRKVLLEAKHRYDNGESIIMRCEPSKDVVIQMQVAVHVLEQARYSRLLPIPPARKSRAELRSVLRTLKLALINQISGSVTVDNGAELVKSYDKRMFFDVVNDPEKLSKKVDRIINESEFKQ